MSIRFICRFVSLLLVATAATACEPGEKGKGIPAPGELAARAALGTQALEAEAAEQEIRKLSDELLKAYRAKNADTVRRFFADSAISASASGGLLRGREAIQQDIGRAFAERPADYQIVWEPIEIRISKGGGMAHELGTWHETRDGETTSGHYLTVWEKTGDEWKVVRDISVPEADPQASEPAAP